MALTTEGRFRGVWRLARRIEDLRAGRKGAFLGEARIAPEGPLLRYEETGLLTLGDARTSASRVYLWRPEEGCGVAVLFGDGRHFHRFDWARRESGDVHVCGDDRYEALYRFDDPSVWRASWRVTGPRKDYRAVSIYSARRPAE